MDEARRVKSRRSLEEVGNIKRIEIRFTDQNSKQKITVPDKTQSDRGVSKTSEEVTRRQDEPSEELRNGRNENDERTYEELMNNRRRYLRGY